MKIAIAWRADTDNEFCTNVVEAFRLAGVNVTVLPQVKASYIDYEGSSVSTNQLDADGIGYLSNDAGLLVRAKAYDGSNVAEVLVTSMVCCLLAARTYRQVSTQYRKIGIISKLRLIIMPHEMFRTI